ncbi:hypothetical protein LINPERHAP2_LOCUS3795 [Linum perenne]
MEVCRLQARVLPGTSHVALRKRTFPAAMASPSSSQSVNLAETRMFMLGMGYVGQIFGQQLRQQGWVVNGTCTSMTKKKELEEKGFDAFVFDANEPELSVLQSLKSCTHLLVSIPPLAGLRDPVYTPNPNLNSVFLLFCFMSILYSCSVLPMLMQVSLAVLPSVVKASTSSKRCLDRRESSVAVLLVFYW